MDKRWQDELGDRGFTILPGVFSDLEADSICDTWSEAIRMSPDHPGWIRNQAGTVFAARNLIETLPLARTVWRREPLLTVLKGLLGNEFGLVRALWFDKPPEQSWSLAWHKDLTIAVQRNDLPSTVFQHPTLKAGVPHVEAPQSLLERMLTLRIHLDPATNENGPLQVIPGSHRNGKAIDGDETAETILSGRGDVLAMRPLLTHSSSNAQVGAAQHRHTMHLEFAATPQLPDGFQWHDYVSLAVE